jgi:hypothetical protein
LPLLFFFQAAGELRYTAAAMPAAKAARAKSPVPGKSHKPEFAPVFATLRRMLERFVGSEIAVQTDEPGNYHLEVPGILHRKKPLYFAGVRTNKNYVSMYLMCAYYSPDLVKSMSPALKKRNQGKACFNFTEVDPECFAELERLTAAGLKKFKSEEFRRYIQSIQ